MKHDVTLTITSLLSTILFAFHWIDEISRGMEKGTTHALVGIGILVVLLCGPLLFGGRLAGYIIMFVGGLFGLGVLVIHMQGAGITGGRIANTSGILFWVMTLVFLGVSSVMTAILAAHGMWRRRAATRN